MMLQKKSSPGSHLRTSGPTKSMSISAVLSAAHSLINSVPFQNRTDYVHPTSFITIDEEGFPSARLVVPLEVAPDFSKIILSTRTNTRKVAEIKASLDRKGVTVSASGAVPENTGVPASCSWNDYRNRGGWLTIKGLASLGKQIEDGTKIEIIFRPVHLEIMSYNEKAHEDADGWSPVILSREGENQWKRGHAVPK
ncbi:unnamed protein product [Polarella glacialis]|uniref:Uncharacterized protein n=1 Tax=Polarella glacialis TaxID=89957 RepID=A0A813EP97_POLGL|nr:unnamed protein product [Polarella glacialis]